jgi:hypothetical protein
MKMDPELDGILAEIGREHRATGAPESLETALYVAAARKQDSIAGRTVRPIWAWGFVLVLIAAIALGAAVWQMRRNHDSRAQSVPIRPLPTKQARPEPPSLQAEARNVVPAVSVPPRRANSGNTRHRSASPQRARRNSLDEFVQLPVSEGLPPAAQLSVVRVRLQGRDLQQYGLEAPADVATRSMLAEFVLGEDGLPRAIRIIR